MRRQGASQDKGGGIKLGGNGIERSVLKTLLLALVSFLLLSHPSLAQNKQSHPLSEITPIDVNLNMTNSSGVIHNITDVGKIGIGTSSPLTPLHVAGIITSGSGVSLLRDVSTDQLRVAGGNSFSFVANSVNGSGILMYGRDHASKGSMEIHILDTGANTGNLSIITTSASGSSATRLRMTTGGNIGIGTTSPGSKLTVLGQGIAPLSWGDTSELGRLTFIGSTPVVTALSGDLVVARTSALTETARFTSTGNVGIGTATPSSKLHISGTGALLNVSNQTHSFLFVNETSGNVGIGTTKTQSKLHIQNGAALAITDTSGIRTGFTSQNDVDKYVQMESRGSAEPGTLFGLNLTNLSYVRSTGDSLAIGTSVASPLVFGTGDNERMRIVSGGNVGIGTTNPQQKLEVVGNLNLSGTPAIIFTGIGSFPATERRIGVGGLGEITMTVLSTDAALLRLQQGGTNKFIFYTNDSIYFGSSQDTNLYRSAADVLKTDDTLHIAGELFIDNIKGFTSSVVNIPSTYNFTVDTNTLFVDASNNRVGTGTTNPSYKLDVFGAVRIDDPTANKAHLYLDVTEYGIAKFEGKGIRIFSSNPGGTDIQLGFATGSIETSEANFVPHFTISNSSGNVGIGTTNPQQKLDVVGIINTTKGINISSGTGNQIVFGGDTNLYRSAADVLKTDDTFDANLLRIQGSNTLVQQGGGATAVLQIVPGFNNVSIANTGNTTIDGTTFVVDGTNDRVGIGTTSPGAKLEVSGGSTQAVLKIDGTVNPEILLANAGTIKLEIGIPTGAGNYITGSAVNDVVFRQSGGQKILFSTSSAGTTNDLTLSGGNVGIGTTSPSAKLEVNGSGTSGLSLNVTGDLFVNDTDRKSVV